MFFILPKNIAEMKMLINIASNGEKNTFEDVQWFCAYCNASNVLDSATNRDLAKMMIDGSLDMKTEESVQAFIESLNVFTVPYEELDDDDKEYAAESSDNFFLIIKDFYE